MGSSRSGRRAQGGNFSLWSPETDQGWRVIRQVSFAEGDSKCLRGEWTRVEDSFGNHLGYQILANCKADEELSSRATPSSITAAENELNAGLRGRSRTAGLAEDERISRKTKFGSPLPPEDAIERAREKVREWGRRRLVARPHAEDVSNAPAAWDQFPELAGRSG